MSAEERVAAFYQGSVRFLDVAEVAVLILAAAVIVLCGVKYISAGRRETPPPPMPAPDDEAPR